MTRFRALLAAASFTAACGDAGASTETQLAPDGALTADLGAARGGEPAPPSSSTGGTDAPDSTSLGSDSSDPPDPPADVGPTQRPADAGNVEPPQDGSPGGPEAGAPCGAADEGTLRCPIVVERFPFHDTRDTTRAPSDVFDAYACRPETAETGPEVIYLLRVQERGLLSARLEAPPEGGPDVDLHLLDAPSADACLVRDNLAVARTVAPGEYHLVADTWADADGTEYPGEYVLTVELRPQSDDACALQDLDLEMFWSECAPGIDCYEGENDAGETRRFLRTPATGPVVKEAHLVTVDDDFGGGWPNAFTDEIERHYALSEAATGYAMNRGEPWAPAGEGGSEYGQGSTGRPLPVLDEAFYVNMYWRRRPEGGTRLLIRNPEDGRAVVASGGYETGPGDESRVGGVTEEIHDHLGTGHLSVLQIGFLVDQSLPLGPIECP